MKMEDKGKKGKTFGLGSEPVVGSLAPAKKKEYRITNRLQEGQRPIYAVAFNFLDSRYLNVFVTVGGNRITVYQCLEGGVIAVLQSYVDEDDEAFFAVSWACSDEGSPFIVAGGSKGIIRVIDAGRESIYRSFIGHGNAINEVRTQTLKPSLVISASRDESLRLWNTQTGICILIFAGAGGHRNEILSVDFHPSDIYRICSCGMDTTVKIWSIKDFWTYVEKSFTWTDLPSKFPTKFVQHPVYSASVHVNYVDCTRWLGDFILSKSVDDEIMLWEPKVKDEITGTGAVDVLQKYPIPECDIWFIKFSCDFHFNIATVGNRAGQIYVWELQSCPPILATKLSHPQSNSPIRQTATSFDGSTILSCTEDGTIWRWDDVSNSST
ncbi:polycomb group protein FERTILIZATION-INDEPENDENT ENDOSPERM isoform X2 [Vigna radiata var. radiata]|uniref:Polycomb group protein FERTILIZATION-INDEPENDENT ENDOSPERM isoform X2 n=1 Tax=Vigna radiata var. radiata TaxID=3916 RepID=A0A1S3VUE6_VIGRR|nr:polycomb group protein FERTILIZATION-INDEPENDENT ENDOSPERM isoform X2 [Vigna radiata var. radiata]